ncbi:MAG TPA: TlpA disulfide reductase family protein [Ktedonobacteraceae bacterium]|nr:TlpA disulfide reductase family protein [Ktedonobacteraceae bacterium]
MEVEDTAERPEGTATGAEKQAPSRKHSRKRTITIFAIVSVINVGLLIFLWTQLLTPAQHSGGQSQDPLIGHAAPDFTLALLSSHTTTANLSTTSYKGQPLVINFWNSTCGPCVDEAPLLQQQWSHMQTQGIAFIGIDFQDTTSGGLSFLQKYGITYPNVMDATGSTAINYGVTGTPETLFINRQGVVVSRVSGELSLQTLQQNLQLISY